MLNMIETKARRQGNSVVIGFPAQLGVKVNESFYVSKDEYGNILLVPKLKDPYAGNEPHMAWHEKSEWEELWVPQGKEVSDE